MSNTGQQNWGSNNPAYYNNNSGFDNTTAKAIQGLVGGYINNSEQYPISNPNPFNNMTANVIQSVVANNNYGQQPYETSNPYAVNRTPQAIVGQPCRIPTIMDGETPMGGDVVSMKF
jgi:hypothetical protein